MPDNRKTVDPAKRVHTLVVDSGPLIRNIPPISTLLAQSHVLLTTPTVVSEIRDPDTRRRVETLYLPFLSQRTSRPESLKVVSEFARKTGDRAVLSRTDLEVIALAYEVECERNGGDWRLKKVPGQKRINGHPPDQQPDDIQTLKDGAENGAGKPCKSAEDGYGDTKTIASDLDKAQASTETSPPATTIDEAQGTASVSEPENGEVANRSKDSGDESDSDPDGWITPSNIKKRQARDAALAECRSTDSQRMMQVATLTTDFAMQNIILQMNLNLLSASTLQSIRYLKSHILRCHACFSTTKEMDKQFCPACGNATLTRVTCSTSADGAFRLHLKKNMQWNTRGDRFSIPRPVSGSASGKWKGGGGQGGWGSSLVLAEDQKEYVRKMADEKRKGRGERDLMDVEALPSILSGDRHKGGERVKVGAGRDVNSRRRRR